MACLSIYIHYIFPGLQVSVIGLERALHNYTMEPSSQPFDMKTVPLATQPMSEQKSAINVGGSAPGEIVAPKQDKLAASRQDIFAGV